MWDGFSNWTVVPGIGKERISVSQMPVSSVNEREMPRRGVNSHTREEYKMVSPNGMNLRGRGTFHEVGAMVW